MASRAKKPTATRRPRRPLAPVIELEAARERLRLHRYGERVQAALDQNRGALQRLFDSGLVFTRSGSRAGRDLLLAHQHLLKVADVLTHALRSERPAASSHLEELFGELDVLLEKTSAIARRNKALFRS